MEDLEKTPTVTLVNDMTILDQQIGLKTLKLEKLKLELYQLQQELAVMIPKYEENRAELIKRFPMLENNVEFQPKKIKKY